MQIDDFFPDKNKGTFIMFTNKRTYSEVIAFFRSLDNIDIEPKFNGDYKHVLHISSPKVSGRCLLSDNVDVKSYRKNWEGSAGFSHMVYNSLNYILKDIYDILDNLENKWKTEP